MIQYQTISVGENRGRPRIYLQGRQLEEAGFRVDERFNLEMFDGYLLLKRHDDGARKVSGKKKRTVPVIDINTDRLLDALGSSEKVTLRYGDEVIVISTERTERQRAARRPEPTEAALFAGGGLLSLAAHQAGFETVWANEVSERYADVYERNLGGAMQVCSIESIETFPERVGLLTAGIPCEPFSRIRTLNKGSQTKRDKSLAPEAHELGDMVFWTLRSVDRMNPYWVVVENVPAFLDSGAGHILQSALRRMGYAVEGRILDPSEYGELTGRKRTVIVASTDPVINWPEPNSTSRRLGEILHAPDDPACEWFTRETKSWLFDHWENQTAKGNGFAPPVLTESTTKVPTIKKRYFAQQGDNPVVGHPTNPDLFRWLTVTEVKRLHGVPDDYDLGDAKTVAGEMLGQGVVVGFFRQIIEALTRDAFSLKQAGRSVVLINR